MAQGQDKNLWQLNLLKEEYCNGLIDEVDFNSLKRPIREEIVLLFKYGVKQGGFPADFRKKFHEMLQPQRLAFLREVA